MKRLACTSYAEVPGMLKSSMPNPEPPCCTFPMLRSSISVFSITGDVLVDPRIVASLQIKADWDIHDNSSRLDCL